MGKRSGSNEFYSGLGMTLAFGAVYLIFNSFFWIFPLVFAGILPMARGAGKILEERSRARLNEPPKPREMSKEDRERLILKSAQKHKGVITPTMIAVESDLTIAQAEEILEDLARRGYASLEVRDTGGIEYRFPDLIE